MYRTVWCTHWDNLTNNNILLATLDEELAFSNCCGLAASPRGEYTPPPPSTIKWFAGAVAAAFSNQSTFRPSNPTTTDPRPIEQLIIDYLPLERDTVKKP